MYLSVPEESNPFSQPTRIPVPSPSKEHNLWDEMVIKEELNLTPSMHYSHPEWYQLLNDSELNYFCGIPKICFQSLFVKMTGESLTLPSCNMSAHDQLLLTLSKYKHNHPFSLLSIIFRIEQKDALAVFSFWTYHVFKTLKLYFGFGVKAEGKVQHCVSVGVMEVPVLEKSSLCVHSRHCDSGEISSLKSIVVIDDGAQTILYCSKLYGKFTSNESILQDPEFQHCVARSTSIELHGSLNVSHLFPDKIVEYNIPDNVCQCLCNGGGVSAGCALSSFQLTKRFQCFTEHYKILSEGVPTGVLVMASELFFNCLMLLNFPKTFGRSF